VSAEDNLARSLELIDNHGIERLPVTSPSTGSVKVVGILSQRDVISGYNQALEARGLREIALGESR
jgi:CBS-domain-containing membrane protein